MATLAANTYNLKLCFSSWVCPEWTVAAILDGMQTYGYQGVELRIGKGHLHGVELDSSGDYLADVRKQFDEANMAVACISTSFSFTNPDILERKKSLDGLRQALRVSEALGAPYVRVFGGEINPSLEVAGVVDYVSETLNEIAEHAEKEKSRSMVLMETSGSFSHSRYTLEVMSQVYSPKLGVLWDVLHPLRVLESVESTYDELGDHIRHVHVHDCDYNEDRTRLEFCAPGEGFVPIPRIADLLKAGLFRGYLSYEPLRRGDDIDPDEALPLYANYLKGIVASAPAK
ncbi:MAG: sugar phosphate isomerase/epimerase [Planctomycetota bacterium]|nr:sugar phosphate isomerase/epimerase [Planctomycetota bacterium]